MSPVPINLFKGWPSTTLLPTHALLTATQRVLNNAPLAANGLLYGPDEGHLPLRRTVASWLDDFYSDAVSNWRRDLKSPPNSRSQPSQFGTHQSSTVTTPPITKGNDESRITITGGASQSLGIILSTLTDPIYTRRVWIIAPAYYLAFKVFQDAGFAGRLRAVPEIQAGEDAGPDVEWLRKEMKEVDASEVARAVDEDDRSASGMGKGWVKPKKTYPRLYRHVIYTVPSFSNPSSLTTTLLVREALVRLAREFDALVVCDDVYDMLQWPVATSPSTKGTPSTSSSTVLKKAPLPRVLDIDHYLDGGPADDFGNVISNGSFSKICAPGCRVGWVEAAPGAAFAISQAGTSKSGGAPSQLTSLFINDLLSTSTLQSHIQNTLLPAYTRRHHLIIAAITTYLVPLGVTLPQPGRDVAGGYFVWLTLPAPLRGEAVAKRADVEYGVLVGKGELFEVPEEGKERRFERSLRLCFAWVGEEEIQEGVRRLATCVVEMLGEERKAT